MKKLLDNKYFQIVISIFIVILFYFFVLHIGDAFNVLVYFIGILKPLIIGLVLAYIMHPIVNLFEEKVLKKVTNKTTRRNLAITITLLIIVGLLTTLISIIIPEVLNSIKSIVVNLPSYLNQLEDIIRNWLSDSAIEEQVMNNYDAILDTITNGVNDIALPAVNSAINNLGNGILAVFKGLLNWLIGMVFAVYILANTKNFGAGIKKVLYSLFDVNKVNDMLVEVKHINHIFVNFMIGKVTDSSIILLTTFLFLLICGFPYPLLIAVIIGLTDLIPYFGPYIGTVPSAILICFVDPIKAIVFVLFIVVLQQIDANLITPRIQSNATGLPSFWVLFAITLFGGLFGVVGLLIGVPCFTIIYELVRDMVDKKLARKNMPTDKNYYEKHDSIEKKTIKAKIPNET